MTSRFSFFALLFACVLLFSGCGLESVSEADGDSDIERQDNDTDSRDTDKNDADTVDPDGDGSLEDGDQTSEDGDISVEDGDTVTEEGLRIYDLRNGASDKHPAIGTTVTIKRVVVISEVFTVATNRKGAFISEKGGGEYAAILLTWKPTSLDAANGYDPPALQPGMVIETTGVYNEFCGTKTPYYTHCSTQIDLTADGKDKGSVTALGTTAPLPAPQLVLPGEVKKDGPQSALWQNALLAVDDVAVTAAADTYGVYTLTGGLSVDDTIYKYTPPSLGAEFDRVVGFLYTAYDNVALLPRDANDLTAKGTLDGDLDTDTNLPDGDSDTTDNDTTDSSTEAPLVNVVTFNVDRFFDTNCDSGDCGSGGYEDVPNQIAYDERAAQIAAAIDAMDADVVILEEIEMQKGLDDINARTKNPYPISVLGETGTTRATVDVGILARGSLVNVYHHYNEPMTTADGVSTHFARDFLELRIKFQNRSLIVFGAHFKSKNSDDAARRLAEAKTAAKILRGVALQNTTALVVMGGDLNDTPDSEPVSALIGDGNLLRAAADCAGTSCATYYYSGQYQSIDHLLLSQDTKGRYVAHSTRTFRGGSGGNIGYAGSDHAALFATFTYAP